MKWSPLLYSCFANGGRGYTCDAGLSEDTPIYEKLMSLRIDSGSWLLGQAEGKVFFGQKDRIGNHLGWDHPIALDKSKRRLTYSLVYTAPRGTPLPSEEALKELQGQVDADLKRLGEEAMKARRVIINPSAVELPDFQKPKDSATPWDKAALASHSSRKLIPTVVISSDGVQRTIETPPNQQAVSSGFSKVGAVAMGAVGTGAIGHGIYAAFTAKSTDEKGQTRRNWGRTALHLAEAGIGAGLTWGAFVLSRSGGPGQNR